MAKVWTPEMRRAFAEKMRLARKAKRNPGRAVHTKKFDRCVRKVKASGAAASAYAVCASELPAGGVKKGHRRRIKNLKPIHGAVIVVHMPKRPMYYARDNVLSSNRTTARVFSSQVHAARVARKIARMVSYRVTVNRP